MCKILGMVSFTNYIHEGNSDYSVSTLIIHEDEMKKTSRG